MSSAEELISILRERNETVVTAESCTGGLIASELVNVSGVSDCLHESYVTYSEEAKQRLLSVSTDTIERFTVYSEETAAEMAAGAARIASADLSISSTGIAGPDGGSEKFPVGLVCLGVSYHGTVKTERHIFSGDRNEIRRQAAARAIAFAISVVS